MNTVQIVGNLGKDPELKTLGDKTVANLNIATKEFGDKTEWHRVTVWGKQAENCGKFLSKGKQVGVVGRLQTRSWEKEDGTKAYSTEIVANNVEFLGSKSTETTEATDTTGDNRTNHAPQFDGSETLPF